KAGNMNTNGANAIGANGFGANAAQRRNSGRWIRSQGRIVLLGV
ncbi:MAG: hypothetical protein QOJ98_412, partial [Acidobacteriota bacterium]|nr:hypothetical protein [Acidobacteriota bacterium]